MSELQAAFHGCRKMFPQLQECLPADPQPEEQDFDFIGCFHDFFPFNIRKVNSLLLTKSTSDILGGLSTSRGRSGKFATLFPIESVAFVQQVVSFE